MECTLQTLTDAEAAYIAGLMDGEGTITLSRRHRNENRQLVLSISSTERYLLEYVQNATSMGQITSRRVYSNKHSPSYTYTLSNRQALQIIARIAPYLRSYKARRAALVLREYLALTPRNGKYSAEFRVLREHFVATFLAIKPA